MKSKIPSLLWAVLAAVLSISSAFAVPLTYTIGGGSTIMANTDDSAGLAIEHQISSSLAGTTFTLDDGQTSAFFDFFTIWTDESAVDPDDLVLKDIFATLAFSIPALSAMLSGETVGVTKTQTTTTTPPPPDPPIVRTSTFQAGDLVWNASPVFDSGDRTFSIELTSSQYNRGIEISNSAVPPPGHLTPGQANGALVQARVTQISSRAASVPENGSTAVLLGLVFVTICFVRRVAARRDFAG